MSFRKLNQKQNYIYLAIFIVGFAANFVFSYFADKNKVIVNISQNTKKNDRILATADGLPIYLGDVKNVLRKINSNIDFDSLNDETKQMVIKEIAAQKILLRNALKHGENRKINNEAVADFLSYQVGQSYLENIASKKIDDKKIKETYDQLAKNLQGKKEYKLQYILLAGKADADRAENALSWESFENVAKKYSKDKQSAANGGNLGYVVEGTLIPKLEEEIKKLSIDQTSKPFKTDLGWNVIKLLDKRDAVPAGFDDVKERIKISLIADEKKSYIKNLIEKTKIKILDSDNK